MTAALLDDTVDTRQPQVRIRGGAAIRQKLWLEESLSRGFVQALSGFRNDQPDKLTTYTGAFSVIRWTEGLLGEREPNAARTSDAARSPRHQVHNHDLKLRRINEYGGVLGADRKPEVDVFGHEAAQCLRQASNELGRLYVIRPQHLRSTERLKLTHQVLCALCCLEQVGDVLLTRVSGVEVLAQEHAAVAHDHQQVVEVVRQTAGEIGDRVERRIALSTRWRCDLIARNRP